MLKLDIRGQTEKGEDPVGVLGRTATVLSTFFGFVRKGTKHLFGLYLRARTKTKYSRLKSRRADSQRGSQTHSQKVQVKVTAQKVGLQSGCCFRHVSFA